MPKYLVRARFAYCNEFGRYSELIYEQLPVEAEEINAVIDRACEYITRENLSRPNPVGIKIETITFPTGGEITVNITRSVDRR